MSYNTNYNTNMTSALSNAIASLNSGSINTGLINPIYTTNTNGNQPFHSKVLPTFKMEMYKSENGGFVMNLITYKDNVSSEVSKLFILNDLENLGRDIQNILLVEILKN